MRPGWRWVLVGGVAPFVAACALIVGIETRPLHEPAASVDDRCAHATPPPKPDNQDDDEQHDFTVAVRSLAYETAGHDIGFDLDSTCTCDSRPGSAFDGGPSCAPAQGAAPGSQCDRDGGIDNAFLGLPFLQIPGVDEGSLNADLDCGSGGLVLGIYGYNGRANDSNVDVAFLPALGVLVPRDAGESPAVCAVAPDRAEVTYRPRWDGTDPWSPDRAFVADVTALYHLPGYVRDWTLFAEVAPMTKIPLPFGTIRPYVHQVRVVASVTPLDDQRLPIASNAVARARYVTLDGTFSGRAPVEELLTVLGRLRSNAAPQCPGTALYDQFRAQLCQAADIATDPGDDHRGLPCSALSLGVHFHAETALQGTAASADAGPSPCDAEPTPCGLEP